MTDLAPVSEDFVLPHLAFDQALRRVRSAFAFAQLKSEAEGLSIIGESGTGKTSVLRVFYEEHLPTREADGMKIPVLFVTVPSSPTVKSLAGVMLETLQAPDPGKGTENEKTFRIRVLLKNVGTKVIIIDEFQHFYDRGTHKTFHHVADWLKILIDQTKTTLIIAGLPTAIGVIEQNEQLMRRFSSPIRLNRFNWQRIEEHDQFLDILSAYHNLLSERYDLPSFSSETMGFRFWLATGGVMSNLSKLLRQLEREALSQGKTTLVMADLHRAHVEAIWPSQRLADLPKPFAQDFHPLPTATLIESVKRIGCVIPLPETSRMRKLNTSKKVSLSDLLVTA